MTDAIKKLAKRVKALKPGQRIILTLPKSYIEYDLELLRNKIARTAYLYPECLTIDTRIESLPTDIEGIEVITSTKVILTRTDFMSAIDFAFHSSKLFFSPYCGQWLKDFAIYCELASTITDPEPNEIPKFHL